MSPNDLRDAFVRACTPRPEPRIDLFHVAPIKVSVMDTVGVLCGELPALGRVTFRELTSQLVERMDVIVHFLAVLELFKQGIVELRQPSSFGDIEVLWQGGEEFGSGDLELVDSYDG
ncbi:MAG: segregation/condensation protein A [Microthrixaceae bacterium]